MKIKVPLAISAYQDEMVRYSLDKIREIAKQTQNNELITAVILLEEMLKKPFVNIYFTAEPSNLE